MPATAEARGPRRGHRGVEARRGPRPAIMRARGPWGRSNRRCLLARCRRTRETLPIGPSATGRPLQPVEKVCGTDFPVSVKRRRWPAILGTRARRGSGAASTIPVDRRAIADNNGSGRARSRFRSRPGLPGSGQAGDLPRYCARLVGLAPAPRKRVRQTADWPVADRWLARYRCKHGPDARARRFSSGCDARST